MYRDNLSNTLPVLNIAVYAVEPASFRDMNGLWIGYEMTILQHFARHLRHRLHIVEYRSFTDAWRAPLSGKIDIATGAISIRPDRIKTPDIIFSHPIHRFYQSLLIRCEDANVIHHFDDLQGKVIGVISGTSGEYHARQMAPPTTRYRYFVDEYTMLSALRQGRIDAIARGTISNDRQAQKDITLVVTGICETNFEETAFVTVKLDLAQTLDTFLEQLNNSGVLSTLHKQWFAKELNVGLYQGIFS